MVADEEKAASVRVESAERSESNESAPLQGQDDVPDGGTMAWLQVFGGFFVFMDTWCELPAAILVIYAVNSL